ncbi:hypothetical protein FNV43_RR09584 [Rhamnella rubrinervis]|uniref:DUF4220 domain-containing protein n=1 Tax=Rhamnella rubrinervis TaxID=2594499 RepID=A0A8K0MKC6_9ROSA|nr:hypothetical protein FNV43_RR09584 [Rhamnella rubrinervis]
MLRALWHIRVYILVSLCLQVFLVLFSSFRQRSGNKILHKIMLMFIWLAYLTADWVAAVTIGLISKILNNPCRPHGNEGIIAFWASFLLLHLGGPDSITSFALEDNEFWLRHLFGLVLQAFGAAYSFHLARLGNILWVPTILVFIVGIIKYAERTVALYLASVDHFGSTVLPEPYPGPDYEEAVAIYSTIRSVHVAEQTEITLLPSAGKIKDPKFDFHLDSESDDLELLKVAYSLFESFKGLIIGFHLSTKLRESSQKNFLQISADVGFKLIAYELSFMYHVLHTKANVVRNRIGLIFRFITFCFMVVALTLFHFIVKKDEFGNFDVSLTYALLIGAISLDMISGIKLVLSDWILVAIVHKKNCILQRILKGRRWSGSVSQYNMVAYCLHERGIWNCKWLEYFRGMIDKIKIFLRSSSTYKIDDLKRFIFDELSKKSSEANSLSDAMEACSQRGDWALLGTSNYIKLKWTVSEFQYAESLLLWHIATEICFQNQEDPQSEGNIDEEYKKVEQFDTFAEAKRYLTKYKISEHKKACEKMFNVKTKFRPGAVKGIRSKSVLFDACILAQQLQHLEEEQWATMSSFYEEEQQAGTKVLAVK